MSILYNVRLNNVLDRQLLAGSCRSMVERYSHQNGEHIQTAMDKLQKRIKVVNR